MKFASFKHRLNTNRDWKRGGVVTSRRVIKMVSGIVRAAISTVMDKTRFCSPRSKKLQQLGQEVLDKSCQSDSEAVFDTFCSEILDYLKGQTKAIASMYKFNSAKREKL